MKLEDVILYDDRASQPAATTVAVGTLYYVTDENVTERSNGTTWDDFSDGGGGSGDVVGPGSATDEALARFDGTTGKLLQNSTITLSNGGVLTFPDNVRQTFNPGADAAGINVGSQAGDPGTPSNGDLWYDSVANELTARINGANVALGAGGGGAIANSDTDTEANIPGSPTDGDLFWPTNGVYIHRYNGSAWREWGPSFSMVEPVDGDFAWINQGSATVSTTSGGIYLATVANASVDWKIRKKAAPSTPYTITAAMLFSPLVPDFYQAGLLFREAGTGELHVFSVQTNTGEQSKQRVNSVKYSSATVFSAAYSQTTYGGGRLVFLRIADNGTNRICSISPDGQNWVVVHTVGRTDFLTADEVGFALNVENGTFANGVTLLSWVQA